MRSSLPPLSPDLNCAHVLSWKWGRQVRGGSSSINPARHTAHFAGNADHPDNGVRSIIVWRRWARAPLFICHIDAIRPPKSCVADGQVYDRADAIF
jgi:hypothetical protein